MPNMPPLQASRSPNRTNTSSQQPLTLASSPSGNQTMLNNSNKIRISIKHVISMCKKTSNIKNLQHQDCSMEAQDASPDQSRDTKVSCPKSKERDTTYQKTKKNKKGENKVLQYISLPFPQGAPVVQNTKYASLFRRLGSPIRTNVPRIQNNQSSSIETLPSNILPKFCLELRLPKPYRTRQKSQ